MNIGSFKRIACDLCFFRQIFHCHTIVGQFCHMNTTPTSLKQITFTIFLKETWIN